MRTPLNKTIGTTLSIIGLALSLVAALAVAQPAPQAAPQPAPQAAAQSPGNSVLIASGKPTKTSPPPPTSPH